MVRKIEKCGRDLLLVQLFSSCHLPARGLPVTRLADPLPQPLGKLPGDARHPPYTPATEEPKHAKCSFSICSLTHFWHLTALQQTQLPSSVPAVGERAARIKAGPPGMLAQCFMPGLKHDCSWIVKPKEHQANNHPWCLQGLLAKFLCVGGGLAGVKVADFPAAQVQMLVASLETF